MENIYMTKVVKVGSSKAVVIPVEILAAYGWERGDPLLFVMATDKMLGIRKITDQEIRKLKEQKPYIAY